MDSSSYVAQEDIQNHSLALIDIIQAMKRHFPDFGDDLKIKAPSGFHDILSSRREELLDKLKSYTIPTYTVSEYVSLAEAYRLEQYKAHKLRLRARDRNGGMEHIAIDDSVSPAESKVIVQEGLKSFGICPHTRVKEEMPLRFQHVVKLKDFESNIVRSPISKTLNLYETILNLLEDSQAHGLDYLQLGILFTKLIDSHLPHLSNTVSTSRDVKIIFNTLLSGLDAGASIRKVTATINNYVRKTKHSIQETGFILCNLQYELYHLQSPKEALDSCRKRAENQIKKILPNFVEEVTKNEFIRYKRIKDLRNEPLSFRQCLNYLSQLEVDSKYALKTEKHFPKSSTAASVFRTQIDYHGNTVTPQKRGKRDRTWSGGSKDGSYNQWREASSTSRSRENSRKRKR